MGSQVLDFLHAVYLMSDLHLVYYFMFPHLMCIIQGRKGRGD